MEYRLKFKDDRFNERYHLVTTRIPPPKKKKKIMTIYFACQISVLIYLLNFTILEIKI